MTQMICSNCGCTGRPRSVTKGSFIIEVILWLCLLVPGLLYSLWRMASKARLCPACGAPNMVPLESPRGREIMAQNAREVKR